MFQWDKSINAIEAPACKVLHLFRSMREVQLALPGVSAQQASAFLCQYLEEAGVCTVAVFHHVALGAGLEAADRVGVFIVHGNREGGQVRVGLADLLQEIQPIAVFEGNVHQNHVRHVLGDGLKGIAVVLRFTGDIKVILHGEQGPDAGSNERVVIDDQ